MSRSGGSSFDDGKAASQQDFSIQEKIDFEMRMRDGICKLLAVSTQKDQILRAVKNLMVCSTRIQAFRSEQQKQTREPAMNRPTGRCSDFAAKDREACRGKIAISDLRIPLMWKGSDHFSNKDRTHRYSVFCLLKIGTQVFDTDLLIVDKTITDICFDTVTVFEDVMPEFQLKIELYSCCCPEASSAITNTPKKLVKKFKTSVGKASGKKLSFVLDDDLPESFFNPDLMALGAKYSLLAHASLGLENVDNSFKTHNLTIVGNEESSFWLPLYGSLCCRFIAQPSCMTKDMMTGFLNQQLMVENLTTWRKLYCVLRGGRLLCYYSPEEIEGKLEPALTVSVNKETRIRAVDKDNQKKTVNFSVINPEAGKAVTQIFAVESREDLYKWMEAFWQHFYDFSQWKHCCEEFMKIEVISPRKPPLFLTKEATSVYEDLSTDSPVKRETLIGVVQQNTEKANRKLLAGRKEEHTMPSWAAMFDGSHQIHVQKCIPPEVHEGTLNPCEAKGKKRRAPLPPSDKPVSNTSAETLSYQSGKENIRQNSPFGSQNCSSNSTLSPVDNFKQPSVTSHQPGPACKDTFTENENLASLAAVAVCDDKPVIAPRQKVLKKLLHPRSHLPSLV